MTLLRIYPVCRAWALKGSIPVGPSVGLVPNPVTLCLQELRNLRCRRLTLLRLRSGGKGTALLLHCFGARRAVPSIPASVQELGRPCGSSKPASQFVERVFEGAKPQWVDFRLGLHAGLGAEAHVPKSRTETRSLG